MPSPAEIVELFIKSFVDAWPTMDATDLMIFFDEDAVYHNIPLESVHGREAISDALEGFMKMGGTVRVDVANVVADGARVVVERLDEFTDSSGTRRLPVMGIFEVRNGVITAWRDYFDLAQFRPT